MKGKMGERIAKKQTIIPVFLPTCNGDVSEGPDSQCYFWKC
jgi:hypothetical protein